jgi:hypothetical protein
VVGELFAITVNFIQSLADFDGNTCGGKEHFHLLYFFAHAFEKCDRTFAPRVFLYEMFAYFNSCFFATVPQAFEVQDV